MYHYDYIQGYITSHNIKTQTPNIDLKLMDQNINDEGI